MSDFLQTFSDPVDEAIHLAASGDKPKALKILQPILYEIRNSGNKPSIRLQSLLEELVVDDAARHGTIK